MHVPHRFSGIGTPAPLLSRPPGTPRQTARARAWRERQVQRPATVAPAAVAPRFAIMENRFEIARLP